MALSTTRPLRSLAAGDARKGRKPDPGEQAEADRAWLALAQQRIRRNLEIAAEIRDLLENLAAAEAALAPLAERFPLPADRPRSPVSPLRPFRRPRRRRSSLLVIVEVCLPAARTFARVEPPHDPGGPWVAWFDAGPVPHAEAATAIAAAQHQHAGARRRLEAAHKAALDATDQMIEAVRKVEARLVWLAE